MKARDVEIGTKVVFQRGSPVRGTVIAYSRQNDQMLVVEADDDFKTHVLNVNGLCVLKEPTCDEIAHRIMSMLESKSNSIEPYSQYDAIYTDPDTGIRFSITLGIGMQGGN